MSQLASTIDVAGIRAGFPSIDGDRVFLDNPGGTQVHRSVYDAVESYYRDSNANLGGPFVTSKASDRILEEARSEAAAFLGAASGSEIVFGANMTTLTMHVSRILCRGLGPGDEILVTGLDHDANVAPWMLAASDRGVTIRQAGIDTESCLVDVDDFASKLSGRTRVAAFGWASNGAGTINDVARLAALCREAGALSYIDAVHYAPHGAIDVGTIGCDFLVCSAYKFFGPHVGILYGRSELLAQHRPYKVRPAPDQPPHSWETGTINLEGIAGTAAAIRYLRGLGIDRVAAYERDLSARLLEGLESIAGVTSTAPATSTAAARRTPSTSPGSTLPRCRPRSPSRNIFVWDGNYYALELMQRLGIDDSGGAVRVGAVHYNTIEEIDAFLEGVASV